MFILARLYFLTSSPPSGGTFFLKLLLYFSGGGPILLIETAQCWLGTWSDESDEHQELEAVSGLFYPEC
jgi:hypothetical protein